MTTDTEAIADVVVAAVRASTASLLADLALLRAEVKALEQRAQVPGPAGEKGDRGEVGPKGHDGMGMPGPSGKDGVDGKDAPAVDIDVIAARAAALVPQAKDGVDGAPGRDGQPGVPGVPGRDGAAGERGEKGMDGAAGRDGTLEALALQQIDERSWRLVRADGSPLTGVFKSDAVLDRGVYQAGRMYAKGDGVTYGGSFWIAQDATNEKPGDGATKWRLAVKAGRDGREGKAGAEGKAGPKGERGDAGRNYQ